MRKIIFRHSYNNIISLENLLDAWKEFLKGKKSKKDVQKFELNLMTNIISLHRDLASKSYKHSEYEPFNISDPKPRLIHKASVRDRLLHHAIYRKLYPFFDKTFIGTSYSCRLNKGTHKALEKFRDFTNKVSRNNTRTCWVLKCDIRKFFASIDQSILMDIVSGYVSDQEIVWLLNQIVKSFYSTKPGIGLPLGNLTSQLLVNVYMNEFDQFVKQKLKDKYYIRYADDFVFISNDKKYLEEILPQIADFLWNKLGLTLHPDKVSVRTIASGVDFLGWVNFPDYKVLRTATRKRMFRGIREKNGKTETVQSYLGLISHGNANKLRNNLEDILERRPD